MTPHDKRSIDVQVEVSGTPEQVWEAIATGPGLTAWFVPAEVEEREGGRVAFDFGSGIQGSGVVTAWEPPNRFAYEERDWSPGAPPLATEFLVETRAGGTCVVRVVSSLFTDSADWDDHLEQMQDGWTLYFRNLQLYVTQFPGERCATILVSGSASPPQDEAWTAMAQALGIAEASEGERVSTAPGAPAFAGAVEWVGRTVPHHGVMLRSDEPAPGTVLVSVFEYQDAIHTWIHAYLFGESAEAVVEREAPRWEAWMAEHFPAREAASEASH
jgi:uncharacterized protein YndB with AHSA1/START domain